METFKLLALCIGPGLAIGIYVFWRDKFDREPLRLMIHCFVLGVLSVGVTLLLSKLLKIVVSPNTQSVGGLAIYAFINVALVEELSKFLFLRSFAFNKKEFNEPYDGITYSVMIGMGFATMENVLYVFNQETYHLSMYVGIIRMFTAVPAHAAMAVMMGYYAGMAKFNKPNFSFLLMGLTAAVIFHGAYDFFLMLKSYPFMFIGGLVSLVVCIWFSFKAIRLHQQVSPFVK